MKRLLISILMLGLTTLSLSAQEKKLTMLFNYYWKMDMDSNKLIGEGNCEDGMEFDFDNKLVMYYTPAETRFEKQFSLDSNSKGKIDEASNLSYEYSMHSPTGEKIDGILSMSQDLTNIRFTVINGSNATVYKVANLLGDFDD